MNSMEQNIDSGSIRLSATERNIDACVTSAELHIMEQIIDSSSIELNSMGNGRNLDGGSNLTKMNSIGNGRNLDGDSNLMKRSSREVRRDLDKDSMNATTGHQCGQMQTIRDSTEFA